MHDSDRLETRHHAVAHFMVSAAVVAASGLFCIAAVWLGRHQKGSTTFFVVPLDGRGHPGIVGVSTAIAFTVVAVTSAMTAIAMQTARQRQEWVTGACLFAALAADQLVGLHERVPGADYILRPLLWVLLLVFVRRVWKSVSLSTGGSWMVIGVVLLAISELIDMYPSGDDPAFHYYTWTTVLEESSLSVGAWCLAVGSVGAAVVIIGRAVAVGALSAASPAPLEPAPHEPRPER